MAVDFICSNAECRRELSVGDELAGRKVKCPKCKTVMVVPYRGDELPACPESGVRDAKPPTGYEATMLDTEGGGEEGNGTAEDAKNAEGKRKSVGEGEEQKAEDGGVESLDEHLSRKRGQDSPFEVEKEIARGGMGAVILARDKAIQRELAVKVMRPQIADSEEHRLRFLEEAQVTGQLEHPNIVPIHELGKDADGNLYFTMKLVKGRSLGQIIESQKSEVRSQRTEAGVRPHRGSALQSREFSAGAEKNSALESQATASLPDLLNIYLKICDGMAFAHSRGVIHRDLKPDNIMVGEFGEVQIMDWGLAKVAGRDQRPETKDQRPEEGGEDAHPPGDGTAAEHRQSKIQNPKSEINSADTDRVKSVRSDSDVALTLEGTVSGTPAYMPPEQAEGKIDLIDHRSDIYSLGAILYEILTLERPVEGKTSYEVLLNVADGKIVPPEERTPDRYIPKELSAVAMKATEKNRRKRYQSVQDLGQDIRLFLEGRAVSAKEDTFVESVVKLVRRNKGVSAAVACALVVVAALGTVSFLRIRSERDRAVAGEQRAAAAEQKQREVALAASKRFAMQAVQAGEIGRWDEAERRARDAHEVALNTPWGHYADGSLARLRKEYAEAVKSFRKALEVEPGHVETEAALAEALALMGEVGDAERLLAEAQKTGDWRTLLKVGRTLYAVRKWGQCQAALNQAITIKERERRAAKEQGQVTDAEEKTIQEARGMLGAARAQEMCVGFAEKIRGLPGKQQIPLVQAKLTEIHGEPVKIEQCGLEGGRWTGASLLGARERLRYLFPLKGLLLEQVWIDASQVSDLEPLKGMPLKVLRADYCRRISDLSPLRGAPLESLRCYQTSIDDLSPLAGAPLSRLNCGVTQVSDLSPLRGMPLRYLGIDSCPVRDLAPLRGMPLEHLECACNGPIKDLSPLKGMPLKYLKITTANVADLAALAGLPLETLYCDRISGLTDLAPLEGMPLTLLECSSTQVRDLTPLRGIKLRYLRLLHTKVVDLGPVEGMPLEALSFDHTRIADLTPLAGAPLRSLRCNDTPVSDLSPLAGAPLVVLECSRTATADLSHLRGMPLKTLEIFETKVTDLTPLEGMELERLVFTPGSIAKGIDTIRQMESIKTLGTNDQKSWKTKEFWKRYDAGEFR